MRRFSGKDAMGIGEGRMCVSRTGLSAQLKARNVIQLDRSRYHDYIEKVERAFRPRSSRPSPSLPWKTRRRFHCIAPPTRYYGRFSDMLKPHGLSPTQFNALRILRGAGDGGRTCTEIAERMINRDPDITRLLDRLERRGLVARSREGRDRRVIITRINQAGLELLRALDRPVEELNRKMLGALGAERLQALIGLLEVIRAQAE